MPPDGLDSFSPWAQWRPRPIRIRSQAAKRSMASKGDSKGDERRGQDASTCPTRLSDTRHGRCAWREQSLRPFEADPYAPPAETRSARPIGPALPPPESSRGCGSSGTLRRARRIFNIFLNSPKRCRNCALTNKLVSAWERQLARAIRHDLGRPANPGTPGAKVLAVGVGPYFAPRATLSLASGAPGSFARMSTSFRCLK